MKFDPAKMPRRRFGKTELAMPVYTCGGMRYQHSWQDVPPAEVPKANQENLEATIQKAVACGINHIETARGYGSSEMQLGRILPSFPRDEIIVQTKVPPTADPKEFRRIFDQSLAYLQLDHVDLLGLHGINNEQYLDWSLRSGGCLDEARKLQAEGRCRHVGFSTHAFPRVVLRAINEGDFDYVNLHWYFVYQAQWPSIQAAAAKDMGVFIISPNDKGGKLYDPPEKLVNLCEPLSPMMFNDLFCLSRPEVHTLSQGASKPSDFDEHLKALAFFEDRERLSSEIAGRLEAEMASVLGADWCARWQEGIPECSAIPGDINVFEIIRLWNLAKSLDLVDYGKMRYNLLGNADHWFPGNTAAGIQKLDISEAMNHHPFRDRISDTLWDAHDLLMEAPKKRLSEGG